MVSIGSALLRSLCCKYSFWGRRSVFHIRNIVNIV